MKKLLFILLLIPFLLHAGDLTKNQIDFKVNYTISNVQISGADTLTANQDSILWSWYLNKEYPVQYAIYIDADSLAGIDTNMIVQVLGKRFDAQDWTQISTATITAFEDTAFEITSQSEPTYTLTFATSTDTIRADTTALTSTIADSTNTEQRFWKYSVQNVAHTATMVPAAVAQ